jgi:short-subunit dehydrogenase
VTSPGAGEAPARSVGGAAVLVTGASSGIGAALARRLAERGATVGIVGRRADRLAEVLADCRAHSPGSRSWVLDLADLDAAAGLALEAWDALDGIDVLVNNAATPKRRAADRLTPDDVEATMRINFFSPARMTLAVLPRMLERGRGTIVNVASMGGRVGIAHEAAYCASKFALSGWSESLAIDLWGSGVDVRLIQPGPVDTDIWDRPGEEQALYDGPLEPPELVADGIVAAIEGDTFEHYLPDLGDVVAFKTGDIDAYLSLNADLRAQAEAARGDQSRRPGPPVT